MYEVVPYDRIAEAYGTGVSDNELYWPIRRWRRGNVSQFAGRMRMEERNASC